jgi:hypothetical protein
MRDAAPDPQGPESDLMADPTCCPGGACGPLFETPLLELAFRRMRDLVRSRQAPTVAAPMSTDLPDPQLPSRKDASR